MYLYLVPYRFPLSGNLNAPPGVKLSLDNKSIILGWYNKLVDIIGSPGFMHVCCRDMGIEYKYVRCVQSHNIPLHIQVVNLSPSVYESPFGILFLAQIDALVYKSVRHLVFLISVNIWFFFHVVLFGPSIPAGSNT